MIQHYIITRFNLKKEGWETSKYNLPVLTPEWLERRFDLFEDFCFSSLKGQKNQDFTWLVYFDVDTPKKFKDRISELGLDYENFQPKFVENMKAFVPSIQQEIQKCSADYIISSRIDNDDCLSENYVETVQQNFEKSPHLGIDFPDGFTLQIAPNYKLGKKRQTWNPFISLIEINDRPQSVWKFEKHGSWKRDPNIKRINGKRVWMSIIHQENKVNEFTGYGNVPTSIFHNFKINPEKKDEIITNLIPYKKWYFHALSDYFGTHFKCSYKDLKRFFRLRFRKP